MAQLIINRLQMPEEILIIIKDFIWFDLGKGKLMRIKKTIHTQIYNSISTRTHVYVHFPNHWWFQTITLKFQASFCKCGEYDEYNLYTLPTCRCI